MVKRGKGKESGKGRQIGRERIEVQRRDREVWRAVRIGGRERGKGKRYRGKERVRIGGRERENDSELKG